MLSFSESSGLNGCVFFLSASISVCFTVISSCLIVISPCLVAISAFVFSISAVFAAIFLLLLVFDAFFAASTASNLCNASTIISSGFAVTVVIGTFGVTCEFLNSINNLASSAALVSSNFCDSSADNAFGGTEAFIFVCGICGAFGTEEFVFVFGVCCPFIDAFLLLVSCKFIFFPDAFVIALELVPVNFCGFSDASNFSVIPIAIFFSGLEPVTLIPDSVVFTVAATVSVSFTNVASDSFTVASVAVINGLGEARGSSFASGLLLSSIPLTVVLTLTPVKPNLALYSLLIAGLGAFGFTFCIFCINLLFNLYRILI